MKADRNTQNLNCLNRATDPRPGNCSPGHAILTRDLSGNDHQDNHSLMHALHSRSRFGSKTQRWKSSRIYDEECPRGIPSSKEVVIQLVEIELGIRVKQYSTRLEVVWVNRWFKCSFFIHDFDSQISWLLLLRRLRLIPAELGFGVRFFRDGTLSNFFAIGTHNFALANEAS